MIRYFLLFLLLFAGCETTEPHGIPIGTHTDYAHYLLVNPYGHSMEPYLKGDVPVILVRESWKNVNIGDVCWYWISYEDNIVGPMHRVIGGNHRDGFIMQGSMNNRPDPFRMYEEDYIGTFAYTVADYEAWLEMHDELQHQI